MEFFAPIQENLAGAFAQGPLFDIDIDAAFDNLVAEFGVVIPEYVEYETPQPVVAEVAPETFEQAWARESAAVIAAFRGNRKSKKGAK